MNIVFFGSGKFAIHPFEAIILGKHNLLSVVTQPDRKSGRGLGYDSTPIKKIAVEKGIGVYQPRDINSKGSIDYLKTLNADLFVVISYGQILSEEVLSIPGMLAINAHASLLPKYRGAAPVNWAIINGEDRTGVTVIKMERRMDSGPMILQKEIVIDKDETSVILEEKLSFLAADVLKEAVYNIGNNNYRLIPQEENNVTFAPKLKKSDGLIDWDKPAEEIRDLIRGSQPWPGAFTYYHGKLLKVYRAEILQHGAISREVSNGEIIGFDRQGILVATAKNVLVLKELQLEAKRIMSAVEFISGHKIHPGDRFDKKKLQAR